MNNKCLRYAAIACLVISLAVTDSVAGNAPTRLNPPSGTTVFTHIPSRHTGLSYRLSVYLPPGHDQPQRTFPVIYAMDGDSRFDKLVSVLRQHRINVILVGVSCVSAERRVIDYTMPGAAKYYQFLTRELIPFIETRYHARPKQRMLSGHSLSGEFVLYALFMEDPNRRYFASYISSDGSFWYQPNLLTSMEKKMYTRSRRLSVNLILSGAGNLRYVTSLYNDITRRGYDGLQVKLLTYEGWDHVEMDAPSFKDGMRFLFKSAG